MMRLSCSRRIRRMAKIEQTLYHVTSTKRQSSSISNPSPFVLKSNYADFKQVEASRPAFDPRLPTITTQSPDPTWKYGQGVSISSSEIQQDQRHSHREIDPYVEPRSMIQNYKLLISGVPRPISFISTVSSEGTRNLSPFSYFQVVDHDPPIFVVGFSARASRPKDTRTNLEQTGECVINIVSEHMIEGVNATSLDVPFGVSEWELSGFQGAPSSTVKAERVRDAIFSVEGRLLEMKSLDYGGYHAKQGKPSGALAIIQATRFWIREDAINEDGSEISLDVLRPLAQLGGISYGRINGTFELPRPRLAEELRDESKGLHRLLPDTVDRPQT
ncbi:hypothetical protein PV10_08299 [Exophiala mesophila]|uniref:Flavin reductase like domain-containing protein n=1 Tax=Exophiala mesophila TaxID=212818 RepID=A0A0D1ZPD5_EXOME|nr:uncharacterized protein PV10_08299 [Exophiala mesophila]KIV88633.1 hypothetical protein PV10_08299 [Exophiala mesophila]